MLTLDKRDQSSFKIALIYFSATGNTKKIADTIGSGLENQNISVCED